MTKARSVVHTLGKFFITGCIILLLCHLNRYSAIVRAEMGKYASHHGVAAAARHFTRKLGGNVSVSTVHSIKKAYIETLKRNADNEGDITALPLKKRGRPLMLGEELDKSVQVYLRKVRECGGVVTSRIAVAAARGILLHYDRSMLAEFGGHVQFNLPWGYSLLKRMNFVNRKATTSKSKHAVSNFEQLKQAFLDDVCTTVMMEEIPPQLILNWDQTGIKIVPTSSWTMNELGAKRVEVVGVNDKRMITAIFCGSAVGDFLPPQVIYQGKTERCHPHFRFPSDWDVTHSPRHWSTEETMIQYVKNIVVPYVEGCRDTIGDKPALVIMDNFRGQITAAINELLESHNIHVTLLPPNTTDLLQPMDISVNKPAKDSLNENLKNGTVSK